MSDFPLDTSSRPRASCAVEPLFWRFVCDSVYRGKTRVQWNVHSSLYACTYNIHVHVLYVHACTCTCSILVNVHVQCTCQLIFLRKSDCLGCAALLCLVVCLILLAFFFLPSHLSLKHVYIHVRLCKHLIGTNNTI